MLRPLRELAHEVLERQQAGRAAEDVVAVLGLHVDHQLREDLERLRLVLQQRIALAIRPEADAVAQAVHVVEMLLPQLVDGHQDRAPLH